MIVIGIDPGLAKTGVGILHAERGKVTYVTHRLISTQAKASMPERLGTLVSGLNLLLDEYRPEAAVVEDVFVAKNARSALLLGQARGALISALVMRGVRVSEFTAVHIKKTVTGYGKAEKEQVRSLMEMHLNRKFTDVPLDATDALAGALCCALHETTQRY